MNKQIVIDGSIVTGKPSVTVSGKGEAAVLHGIHVEDVLRYGTGVILVGWIIGDVEIRLFGGAGPLDRPASASFGERPDLRAIYKLPPKILARSFFCCVTDVEDELIGVAGFADGRRRVMTGLRLPQRASVDEVEAFLSRNHDKSGAIVRAVADQPDWMSVLFATLPMADDSQKVARVNVEDARVVPGVGGLMVGWGFTVGRSELFALTKDGWCSNFNNGLRWHRPDIVNAFTADFANNTMNAGFVLALPPQLQGGEEVCVICVSDAGAYRLMSRKVDSLAEDPTTFARWSFALPTAINDFQQHYAKLDGSIVAHLIKGRNEQNHRLDHSDTQFGPAVEKPKCSIVVPLYGRFDFMFNQFLEFAEDPIFKREVDLIYVVDDPRIVTSVMQEAPALHQYYKIPFRVINGNANRGFSSACNLGFRMSRAERVLMLNSDVIPIESGWLEKMIAALEGSPEIGIVGARLRYPNGSLQHDSIAFQYHDPWRAYINKHPGMRTEPPPASLEPVERLAVTGACMLMRCEDYAAVGGLDEQYFIGDFEDTDLCLKFRNIGKRIVSVENVHLVHLERQSFIEQGSGTFRSRVTQYNALRHQERWGALISSLLATQPEKV